MVLGEPFGKLAALRVPQPDPVADAEPVRRRADHRGLHFARTLDRVSRSPAGRNGVGSRSGVPVPEAM